MSAKQRRQALFEVYSANLTSCHPTVKETFLCPICRSTFGRDGLDNPPSITVAHCIPEKLGGRLVTLVCTECDTEAGAYIDRHLKSRFETADFWRGDSPDMRRTWLVVNGLRVRCDLQLRKNADGTIDKRLFADAKHSPMHDFHNLVEGLRTGAIVPKATVPDLHIEGLDFSWHRAQVSVLRCAFLMMFRFLGYGYVLHPNLHQVLLQLHQPDDRVLAAVPLLNITTPGTPMNTIGVITRPSHLRAFCVNMRFVTSGGTETSMAVLMPGLDTDGASVFKKIADAHARDRHVDVGCTVLPHYHGVLSLPNSIAFPHFIWRKYACRNVMESG